MSTAFYLYDPEKRVFFDYLFEHYQDLRKDLERTVRDYCSKAPAFHGSKEVTDQLVEKLAERTSPYSMIELDDDAYEIGVSTAKGFYWNVRNGYTAIQTLEQRMEEHPTWRIFSEYWEEYSLEAFKKREKL